MIAVYVSPESLTAEQYRNVDERLRASGAPDKGRKHRSCFGDDGHLMVFDIWDSQEDYDAFAQHLIPVLEELHISAEPPVVMPVVNLIQ